MALHLCFLTSWDKGLVGANPDELAAVEVTPSAIGLHWEKLDVDLTVPSLLRGVYGTKA